MEQKKYYVIKKTAPGSIYFTLFSIENNMNQRIVQLTPTMPSIRVPREFALSAFINPAAFSLYKKGYFTFDDNDAIFQDACLNQLYFGDELEFQPSKEDYEKDILDVLQKGQRTTILELLKEPKTCRDIITIARAHIGDLKQNVISLLEKELEVQLTIDGE